MVEAHPAVSSGVKEREGREGARRFRPKTSRHWDFTANLLSAMLRNNACLELHGCT